MSGKTGSVSWKFNRFLSNLAFRFRKFRLPRRIMGRPSFNIIAIVLMAFAIFILAGGVYTIVEIMSGRALTMLPSAEGWTFIYPGTLNMQTINESLISGTLYFLGAVGLYLVLRSVKLAYRPRQAYLTLIIGLMLVLLIVYYTSILLQTKIGG
ncbi:MAG: hypothetical protein NWE90_02910 [Candidatus Bathyarchaeota archaeon]|nr:hypothetical protein [Candidatus Bathyarchaeota archaeon]